jgi:hypothetical protein
LIIAKRPRRYETRHATPEPQPPPRHRTPSLPGVEPPPIQFPAMRAGQILTDKRNRLEPELVADLVFCAEYLDFVVSLYVNLRLRSFSKLSARLSTHDAQERLYDTERRSKKSKN